MEIVYQDKRIVVAVKPSGVLSTDEPGGAPELLRAQLGTECIRTVHRLDAPVSGLMVFARSSHAAAEISAQIRDGAFSKAYLAVLRGHPQEPAATLTDLLFRDASHNKSYVVKRMRKGVREARLSYEEVGRTEELSLVRVQLYTGRTHQIRVQFASRGLPLLGDIRYGSKAPGCTAALWSYHLGFRHPVTGKPVDVTCPPPQVYPWDLFGGVK